MNYRIVKNKFLLTMNFSQEMPFNDPVIVTQHYSQPGCMRRLVKRPWSFIVIIMSTL